jgi:hypothetical protein
VHIYQKSRKPLFTNSKLHSKYGGITRCQDALNSEKNDWFTVSYLESDELQFTNIFVANKIFILCSVITRGIPKVMSYIFLHANWVQQTKESMVVDETSSFAILECLVTSKTCIT